MRAKLATRSEDFSAADVAVLAAGINSIFDSTDDIHTTTNGACVEIWKHGSPEETRLRLLVQVTNHRVKGRLMLLEGQVSDPIEGLMIQFEDLDPKDHWNMVEVAAMVENIKKVVWKTLHEKLMQGTTTMMGQSIRELITRFTPSP
jgi:hypothetical protein